MTTTLKDLLAAGADASPALSAPGRPALSHGELRALIQRTLAEHGIDSEANGRIKVAPMARGCASRAGAALPLLLVAQPPLVPLLDGNRRFLGTAPRAAISLGLLASIAGFGYGMFQPHPTVVAEQGATAPVVTPDAGEADGNDWTAYGRNTHGERFAQFEQINKSNVKDLQVAWTFRTGDMAINGAEYQGTPLKVDDTVYLCTPLNKVFALDPVTGQQKWTFDPHIKETPANKGWKRCRGVGYHDADKAQASASEAEQYVGELQVVTDENGEGQFAYTLPQDGGLQAFTATVTRADGATSELSKALVR